MNRHKRQAPLAGGARRKAQGTTRSQHSTLLPSYRVVIATGHKRGEWGRFPTIEHAAAIAARLRRAGLDARVVEPVDMTSATSDRSTAPCERRAHDDEGRDERDTDPV